MEPSDPHEAHFSHVHITVFTSTLRDKRSHSTDKEGETQRGSSRPKAKHGAGMGAAQPLSLSFH